MNERKIEFIKASVLGTDYWKDKTTDGTTNEQKLKKEFEDIYNECCQDKDIQEEIKHVKNLLNNKARRVGFGGWTRYVPSKEAKQKNLYDTLKQEEKNKFDNCFKIGKKAFVDWYFKEEKTCCYCGVREKDAQRYFKEYTPDENGQTKKAYDRGRGFNLEVERLETFSENKNIYNADNCKLACYICNNAKSDFISPKDFKPIAEGINKFWQEKLKDNQKAVEDLKVFWEHQKDNKDIFKG